jgi:nitrogen fixation NifU-like protein
MSDLQSLYQEIILDHSKRPIGFGLVEDSTAQSHQLNPTCGDEVTLQITVGDGALERITWEGHGCAISQASASLLAQLVRESRPTTDAMRELIEQFRTALRSRGTIAPDEEVFGDAAVLGGVSRYTARVKCAMLAWVAAEHALAQATEG